MRSNHSFDHQRCFTYTKCNSIVKGRNDSAGNILLSSGNPCCAYKLIEHVENSPVYNNCIKSIINANDY